MGEVGEKRKSLEKRGIFIFCLRVRNCGIGGIERLIKLSVIIVLNKG